MKWISIKKIFVALNMLLFKIDSHIEIFTIPENCPCIIGGDATMASGNPMFKTAHKK